jgi:hypothetical protein
MVDRMPAFKYGLFFGSLIFAVTEWAPQPAGAIALWTMLAVLMVSSLWITWRRLRLPWFAAGSVAALLVSLAMIPISARGLNLATIAAELPLAEVAAIWSATLFVPLSIGLESLRASPEWRAWSAATERATLWQMITFQHVPNVDRHGTRR